MVLNRNSFKNFFLARHYLVQSETGFVTNGLTGLDQLDGFRHCWHRFKAIIYVDVFTYYAAAPAPNSSSRTVVGRSPKPKIRTTWGTAGAKQMDLHTLLNYFL